MKHVKDGDGYFVFLEPGDKVIESLSRFVVEKELQACSFSGIGEVRNARIGYFQRKRKAFKQKTVAGDCEVFSLSGNLSWYPDGRPLVHLHIGIADRNFKAYGGHLFEAETALMLEIYVSRKRSRLQRRVRSSGPCEGLLLVDLDFKAGGNGKRAKG